MPQFHVRVVLQDAKFEHYEKLHEAMAGEGFSRTITSDKGIEYHLPDAEYRIVADLTLVQVGDRTKRAAETVQRTFSYLATQVTATRWQNLEKV
jgi:hypothetical protein